MTSDIEKLTPERLAEIVTHINTAAGRARVMEELETNEIVSLILEVAKSRTLTNQRSFVIDSMMVQLSLLNDNDDDDLDEDGDTSEAKVANDDWTKDGVKAWVGATKDQVEKFLRIGRENGLKRRADGTFVPVRPVVQDESGWTVNCPVTGRGFSMLKRYMSARFNLTLDETRMMFNDPSIIFTAKAYTEAKKRQGQRGPGDLGGGPERE